MSYTDEDSTYGGAYGGAGDAYIFTNEENIEKIRKNKKHYDIRFANKFMRENIKDGEKIRFKNVRNKEKEDIAECTVTSVDEFDTIDDAVSFLEKKKKHQLLGVGEDIKTIISVLQPFFSRVEVTDKQKHPVKFLLFGFKYNGSDAEGGFVESTENSILGGKPRKSRSKSKSKAKKGGRPRSKSKNRTKKK